MYGNVAESDYIENGNSKIETSLNLLTLKGMKLMRKITQLTYLVIMFMTFSLTHINASINSETTTHQTPQSKGLTVKISDKIMQVATPLNPSTAPVTVKIVSNTGTVLFEKTTTGSSIVVDSATSQRLYGDGIDHRVHSDGIDHRTSANVGHIIEVYQAGQVIFTEKL